jgi:antirestriction protein ArdC
MQPRVEKRDLAAEITARILEVLESGSALPWRMPWSTQRATVGGLPYSLASRKFFSGVNVWLLSLTASARGYRSSAWLTFNAARKLGGYVRKGERGTPVIFYKTLLKTERDRVSGEETTARIPLMRSFVSFNADQCDGLPAELLAKHMPSPERVATTEAAQWFESRLPGLKIEHGHAAAYYRPDGDVIHLPAREDFATEAAYFGTLAHESAHASGAAHRLDRSTLRDYSKHKAERAAEELTADIGASLISARLGRDFDVGNHESYVASWAELLRNDKRAILRACAAAQRAADFICGPINGSEEESSDTENE